MGPRLSLSWLLFLPPKGYSKTSENSDWVSHDCEAIMKAQEASILWRPRGVAVDVA